MPKFNVYIWGSKLIFSNKINHKNKKFCKVYVDDNKMIFEFCGNTSDARKIHKQKTQSHLTIVPPPKMKQGLHAVEFKNGMAVFNYR